MSSNDNVSQKSILNITERVADRDQSILNAPVLHQKNSRSDILNNSTDIGDYSYVSPHIGKGSFSRVYYGHHKPSGDVVAVKKINKKSMTNIALLRVKREIELMKKLDHTNIIRYRDTIESTNHFYIITDYCNGGTLHQFIEDHRGYPENFPEEEIKIYMRGLRNGLEYLVSRNIYHRDLKSHNIFLHYKTGEKTPLNIELKIGDFGFAKEISECDDMNNTLCGTPMYISPEIIYEKKYYINSDLWSVGIILFQLFYGYFPFGTPKNILELMRNMDYNVLKFPLPNENEETRSIHQLLDGLLKKNPRERMTWNEFFLHRWFDETSDVSADMMNTMELNGSLLIGNEEEIDNLYIDNPGKSIIDDTKKKISGRIDIVENYCDRFSMSMPIAIPNKNVVRSTYKAAGSEGSNKMSFGWKPDLYKYLSYSIDNIISPIGTLIEDNSFLWKLNK